MSDRVRHVMVGVLIASTWVSQREILQCDAEPSIVVLKTATWASHLFGLVFCVKALLESTPRMVLLSLHA